MGGLEVERLATTEGLGLFQCHTAIPEQFHPFKRGIVKPDQTAGHRYAKALIADIEWRGKNIDNMLRIDFGLRSQ